MVQVLNEKTGKMINKTFRGNCSKCSRPISNLFPPSKEDEGICVACMADMKRKGLWPPKEEAESKPQLKKKVAKKKVAAKKE